MVRLVRKVVSTLAWLVLTIGLSIARKGDPADQSVDLVLTRDRAAEEILQKSIRLEEFLQQKIVLR